MGFFLTMGIIGIAVVLVAILLGDVIEGALNLDVFDGDLFSLAGIAAFIGAFGFGGYLTLALVEVTWLAVVVGLVAGGLAGWGATALTRWLKRSESTAGFDTRSLIGAPGRVITAIPADGLGEVHVQGPHGLDKWSARADLPIPAGTEIWVSGIVSPTALEVTPAHGLPALPEPGQADRPDVTTDKLTDESTD